jgi:Mor family transcriptional regulator
MTQEFHKVEIDLPLDVADELAAKAGSVDAAVIHALQEYLKTDQQRRDRVIRQVYASGKTIPNIARIYAMSEETIQEIINT